MADTEALRLHVQRQRDKIIDIIDSEFGLLNIFLENQVLSYREIRGIKSEITNDRKNEMLLNIISENDKHEDFIAALKQSSQNHVVNWIIADGNYSDEFGLDWPLTDKENEILNKNQRTLVEILDTCDLLNRLYSEEVINKWHKEFIESKPTNHDKNEALLDIVRRLSSKGYSIFINCLRDSNQGHIADIFEFGGVIVPVHATLQGDNLDEAESQIVNRMVEELCSSTRSMDHVNRLLAAVQLQVIAVMRGESIVLYVKCCKEYELANLRKVVENMELKETLERLFNLLLRKTTIKVLVVKIFETDLAKEKETFAPLPVKEKQRNRRIRHSVVDMYKDFVSEVDPKNVFDLLIQKRVISIEQKQKITNKVTTNDRCRVLLDHLFSSSNDESFIVLREALEDHYHWIVERIDQCETENEATSILDAITYQDKITHAEHQEHMDDALYVNLSFNVEERLKKEVDAVKINLEIENKHLAQKLEESRKETAEMKEQYRILKEDFDKALNREEHLMKELDAIKNRPKLENRGIGIDEEVLAALITTLTSNESQQNPSESLSESWKLLKSKFIVFGIDDGVSINKDIIDINLNQSNDVSREQQMPVQMIHESAAAVHCDSIFVTGIGKQCDEIWRFNATSSKWKKCASLAQSRIDHSAAFVDHILYICGGWVISKNKTLDDVEAYDTHMDQCVAVGKLSFAVESSGNCVSFNSSLYIFGGLDANDEIVNKVQVYDTKLNTCTRLSKPMPKFQYLLRAALWENIVILLGYDGCLTYNLETEVWKVRERFKTDVGHFGLTISNGLVFVIGGGDTTNDADGNEKWICRDDVRCVPVVNILNDEPIEWKHHAKLPKPSLVHAFGRIDFVLK